MILRGCWVEITAATDRNTVSAWAAWAPKWRRASVLPIVDLSKKQIRAG